MSYIWALASAEAQIGNTTGAENFYQHAEHYFGSMSFESESHCSTVVCDTIIKKSLGQRPERCSRFDAPLD
jgi:hypothetical protein